jgi:hypothetical protein
MDGRVFVAGAVVVLFAVVGVVSAGLFVANKVSSSPTSTPTRHPVQSPSSALAAQDVARAQAQATAIVKQAQAAGRSIIARSHKTAQHQAQAVLAAARRQAAAAAPAPAPAPAAPAPTSAPIAVSSGSSTGVIGAIGQTQYGSSSTYGATSTGSATSGTTTYAPVAGQTYTAAGSPPRASVPNLSGVPASWLVVGYGATFGNGPGSAGSISVVNRSGKTFSGVATVTYASGGSASAAFSGLAPGQAVVLPLNGARYPGGGYKISMSGLH